jgi:hypothetical protein
MAYLYTQKKLMMKLAFLIGGVFSVLLLSGWINTEPDNWNRSAEAGMGSIVSATAPNLSEAVALPPAQGNGEVDVIRNGGFEGSFDELLGVADEWAPYTNGQAFVGWYDEQWPEAVFAGDHSQLMEIDEVDGNVLDSVIAIFQTVEVVPNSEYDLTIHALMRTDAPEAERNNNEYEMNWGIDPTGSGDYDNVQEWVLMPLTEQLRIGSNGEFPEDVPLFYEVISGTVVTSGTNSITLFIRGVKKFPTGTEVNFDVDNVSLIGPDPAAAPAPDGSDFIAPADAGSQPAPVEMDNDLPQTGAGLSTGASVGIFTAGGLILVVIGTAAAASLLGFQKRP